jgi:hypothetical protein
MIQRFHLCHPQQIPANFAISQSPSQILPWVLSVLLIAASSLIANRKAATKTVTGPGVDGQASADKEVSVLTPSSLVCLQLDKSFSVALASPASEAASGPPVWRF